MSELFSCDAYWIVVISMAVIAVFVFLALQKINAGYGMMYNSKWGPCVNNRLGWVLMESPVFIAMLLLWIFSPRKSEATPIVLASIFELHYFQRSFIFPLLLRGKGKMPVAIILMGMVFNLVNAYMIGGWIFYVSPSTMYSVAWLASPQFIIGVLIYFAGMAINIHSDSVIRNLRKPGDTGHYIPRKGFYRYVASANYFGEFVEWCGYAVLTWSWAGAVFALWTFANLAPRAGAIRERYSKEFGETYRSLQLKRILPFIY